MARCKYCNRSGLFLSVSRNGLCSSCEPLVAIAVQRHVQIINESMGLIERSKNLDTKLGRCEDVIRQAEMLLDYQKKGISISINRPLSELIREYQEKPTELICETLKREADESLLKIKSSTTSRAKLNTLSKTLARIHGFRSKVTNYSVLDGLEKRISETIHQIQLDDLLDKARKAEFKQQLKKALDAYYEVLYFLKHDDIDDTLQEDRIQSIEIKIKDLGGDPSS